MVFLILEGLAILNGYGRDVYISPCSLDTQNLCNFHNVVGSGLLTDDTISSHYSQQTIAFNQELL